MNENSKITFGGLEPLVKGPLNGVRVLDLGIITAGAGCSSIFADFGATVVKVEAGRYPDPFRFWSMGSVTGPLERSLDGSAPFNAMNRSKFGICIDLKQDEGRETVLRLAASSDLVVENFRSGVLARLGLGYKELAAANPRVVLISISSQGDTGPEKHYGSYGSTLDAISGIMSVTGYSENEPRWSGADVNYPDQLGSILGAGVAMAAILSARGTGHGREICMSQREMVTGLIGEMCMDYAATGTLPVPRGNTKPDMAPHGVYACRDGGWVAIAVQDDLEWKAFAALLGGSVSDRRFEDFPERCGSEIVESAIAAWASGQEKNDAATILQTAGVTAFPVLDYSDRISDPHFVARKWFQSVEHPVTGPQVQRGSPFNISGWAPMVPMPAPLLGQHTSAVLSAYGFTPSEIARLDDLGVTSNIPVTD